MTRGRPPFPMAFWHERAAEYAAAVDRGEAPGKALASRFGVSRGTASSWVSQLRRRGLVPEMTRAEAIRQSLGVPSCPTCGSSKSRWRLDPEMAK